MTLKQTQVSEQFAEKALNSAIYIDQNIMQIRGLGPYIDQIKISVRTLSGSNHHLQWPHKIISRKGQSIEQSMTQRA